MKYTDKFCSARKEGFRGAYLLLISSRTLRRLGIRPSCIILKKVVYYRHNRKRGDIFEDPISCGFLCGLAHFAMLCGIFYGYARRRADLYRMDGGLSADSLFFLCEKISPRRQKKRAIHTSSLPAPCTLLFRLLFHARGLRGGTPALRLVRALGTHRADPQAEDPLLLISFLYNERTTI